MKVLTTIEQVQTWRSSLYLHPSTTIGFVPTMGGLHKGHHSLILSSLSRDTLTIVSIFLNPAQFAPTEDLHTYPANRTTDFELCRAAGVHLVFAPESTQVYPDAYGTWVTTQVGQPEQNEFAEGASRPTFFRGVATVLAKLFSLIRPHRAYFGQKDAQQCAVVRQLVRDLWLSVHIVVVDTVREHDGLAMSSRNAYLTHVERQYAPVLYHALVAAQNAFRQGMRDSDAVRNVVRDHVTRAMAQVHTVYFNLMYVSVCHRDTMQEVSGDISDDQPCLVCIAAMLGKTRLIDNVVLHNASVT